MKFGQIYYVNVYLIKMQSELAQFYTL